MSRVNHVLKLLSRQDYFSILLGVGRGLCAVFDDEQFRFEHRQAARLQGWLAVLATTTSLPSGCETVRCEDGKLAICPPVVEYSREFQA